MDIGSTSMMLLIQSNRYFYFTDFFIIFVQEMMILHEVDKPGSDIEEYISSLDAILLHKMDLISVVRQRLLNFYTHIKMEENLQKLYQTKQAMLDGDSNLLLDQMDYEDEQMLDDLNGENNYNNIAHH